MENIISNDDRIAIAEVDYIIHHMNERYFNRIPQKVRDYITILKKKNIEIYVDPHKPLEKQNLKEFTLYFLMILNLKYWCNDERRKDIIAMMEDNQKKYDDKINNIFGNAKTMQSSEKNEAASNKPRQITTVGNDVPVNNKNTQEIQSNEVVKQEEQASALEELKQQEQSIMTTDNENILIKIINKIKELKNRLIRSK